MHLTILHNLYVQNLSCIMSKTPQTAQLNLFVFVFFYVLQYFIYFADKNHKLMGNN